jgi:UDP-glucose:(heptosyl)LPS alpha-1,3-glucosyltransferase
MEGSLYELVRLGSDRVEFIVVSSTLDPALRPLVTWRRVPVPRRPFPVKFVLFFILAPLAYRRRKGDLVHTMGAIIPRRTDVMAVHLCHAALLAARQGVIATAPSWYRWLNGAISLVLGLVSERWYLRSGRASVVTVVSGGARQELTEHYPNVPVLVVPNGVDLERFHPDLAVRQQVRAARGVGPMDVVLLFVGGRWGDKGLELAVQALARLKSEVNVSVRLWVVGSGDIGYYKSMAARLGVGERVTLFPFNRNIESFYQAADIFLLPSIYETFSMVAYEAASCGLPIVATPVNGILELLEDGCAGTIVGRNAKEIAGVLAQLVSDADLRRQMGEVGRQRTARFTWAVVADLTISLYESLAGGGA